MITKIVSSSINKIWRCNSAITTLSSTSYMLKNHAQVAALTFDARLRVYCLVLIGLALLVHTRSKADAAELHLYDTGGPVLVVDTYYFNGIDSGVIVNDIISTGGDPSIFQVDDIIVSVEGETVRNVKQLSSVIRSINHTIPRKYEPPRRLFETQNRISSRCSIRSGRDGAGNTMAIMPVTLLKTVNIVELSRILRTISTMKDYTVFHTFPRQEYCPDGFQDVAIPVRLLNSAHWSDILNKMSYWTGSPSADSNRMMMYNLHSGADEQLQLHSEFYHSGDDNWLKKYSSVSPSTRNMDGKAAEVNQYFGIKTMPFIQYGEPLGAFVLSISPNTYIRGELKQGDIVIGVAGVPSSLSEKRHGEIHTVTVYGEPKHISSPTDLEWAVRAVPFWRTGVEIALDSSGSTQTATVDFGPQPTSAETTGSNMNAPCEMTVLPDRNSNKIAVFSTKVLNDHSVNEIVDLLVFADSEFDDFGTYHTFRTSRGCGSNDTFIATPLRYISTHLHEHILKWLASYKKTDETSASSASVGNVNFFQSVTTAEESTIPLPPFAQIRPGETVADFVRSESANMNIVEPKSPIVTPVNDPSVGLESIPAFAVADYQSKLLLFQQFYGFKPFEVGSTSEALKNPLFLNAFETAMAGANQGIAKEKARLAALPLTDPETAEIKRWSNITIEDLRTAIARLGTAEVKPDDISKAGMLITAAYSFKKLDANKVEDAILINHGLAVIHFVQSAPAVQMGITAALQARKAGPETAIVPSRPVVEPIPPVVQREPEFSTPAVYSDPAPSSPFKAFVTFFANSLAMDWGDELVCRIRHGSDAANRLKCYSDLNNELVRLAEGAPWPATIGAAIGWFFAPIGFFLRIFNLWKVNSSGEYVKRSVAIESFEGVVSAAAGYYQPVATLMSVVLPIAVGFAIGLIKGVGEVAASEIKSAWPKIVQTFWNIVCFGALLGGLLLIGANSG